MQRARGAETVELIVDETSRIAVMAAIERGCQAFEDVGDGGLGACLRKQGDRASAFDELADAARAMGVKHHQAQVTQFALKRRRLACEVLMSAFVYAQPRRDAATVRPAIRTAIHPTHSLRSPALEAGYSSFM